MRAARSLPALAAVLVVLLAGVAVDANAQGSAREPWRFSSSVGVDETWSDNINLGSNGTGQSGFATTISPAFRVSRISPTLNLDFGYSPQYVYYSTGRAGSGLRNYLDAVANAVIVKNLLTFDARASITQQNISPFGTLAADTYNSTNNRAETRTYQFGPTLQSRFGNDFTYNAGYRYTGSTADSSAYNANHTNQLFAGFQSGTTSRDLGYGVQYNRTDQDYGGAGQLITQALNANAQYVLSPTFRLQATVGYDKNTYPATGQPDLSGAAFSAGFIWNPSRHTSLNALYGHRYFGPSANIVFQEQRQRGAITISYSRDQTTSAQSGIGLVPDPNYALVDLILQASIPDPAQRATAVAAALQAAGLPNSQYSTTGFLSNQLYLQKRFGITLALLGIRNNVSFDAYRSDSQVLSNLATTFDVFDSASRFRQTSVSVTYGYKLGPRTALTAAVSHIRNKALVGAGDTRQTLLTASANRSFGRHATGSLQVRHTQQTNNGAGSFGFSTGSYTENAVIGSLRYTFQ